MRTSRKALGKGLRSLIPEKPARSLAANTPNDSASVTTLTGLDIDIDQIRPNPEQPRQRFDEESLEALALSLKTQGVLQPVVVRPLPGGQFELVVGERRWRAAQRAGLLKIPAVIRKVPDDRRLEFALIENLQREGLNPIEEAQAYRTLLEVLHLTQQEVATRLGRSRASIANMLRLLTLPAIVQEKVRAGGLTMGHARALAAHPNAEEILSLAETAIREKLSVRQVEELVARFGRRTPTASRRATPAKDPNVLAAEEKLQRALGTKVQISQGPRGGTIQLVFFSDEELQRLYEVLLDVARVRKAGYSVESSAEVGT